MNRAHIEAEHNPMQRSPILICLLRMNRTLALQARCACDLVTLSFLPCRIALKLIRGNIISDLEAA